VATFDYKPATENILHTIGYDISFRIALLPRERTYEDPSPLHLSRLASLLHSCANLLARLLPDRGPILSLQDSRDKNLSRLMAIPRERLYFKSKPFKKQLADHQSYFIASNTSGTAIQLFKSFLYSHRGTSNATVKPGCKEQPCCVGLFNTVIAHPFYWYLLHVEELFQKEKMMAVIQLVGRAVQFRRVGRGAICNVLYML
jgi:hypothetical protein